MTSPISMWRLGLRPARCGSCRRTGQWDCSSTCTYAQLQSQCREPCRHGHENLSWCRRRRLPMELEQTPARALSHWRAQHQPPEVTMRAPRELWLEYQPRDLHRRRRWPSRARTRGSPRSSTSGSTAFSAVIPGQGAYFNFERRFPHPARGARTRTREPASGRASSAWRRTGRCSSLPGRLRAQAAPPAFRRTESRHAGAGGRASVAQRKLPPPVLPPEAAFRRGWMPLAPTGVPVFAAAAPDLRRARRPHRHPRQRYRSRHSWPGYSRAPATARSWTCAISRARVSVALTRLDARPVTR